MKLSRLSVILFLFHYVAVNAMEANSGTQAVFHEILPGKFKMGKVGDQIDMEIRSPFEMMDTLVTQTIWRKVAELSNKSHMNHNVCTLRYDLEFIDVDPSYFKGDVRPVENISYATILSDPGAAASIQAWINALNILSACGYPALKDIIPDQKMGDIYRLPTTDEWEFVVRGRGQLNDVYYFGHDVSRLRDYAWFYDNSDKESHPVAQKLPLVVDGNAFYDMLGNVWEIVEPWYQGQTVQDLIRWYGHHFIETRGGSFFEPDRRMDSATIDFWGDGYKSKFTGFRLVRTNHR